jgi:hypothetical protein
MIFPRMVNSSQVKTKKERPNCKGRLWLRTLQFGLSGRFSGAPLNVISKDGQLIGL